jgi:phosphoribosylglycinamide formyltransferase-1
MLAVLTYDAPHRKTQDLLRRLKELGHTPVEVVATPWKERKRHLPLVAHRPSDPEPVGPEEFARRLGFGFRRSELGGLASVLRQFGPELVLIGGAGILPAEIVESLTVINSHPGWLPDVRGLDALKWAILEELPIGVTVHVAAPEADAGHLIRQAVVPIRACDTFETLAARQYEMEIRMLADAVVEFRKSPILTPLDSTKSPVRKRMPREKEEQMLQKFATLVARISDEPTRP